jgi:hypothetical protein
MPDTGQAGAPVRSFTPVLPSAAFFPDEEQAIDWLLDQTVRVREATLLGLAMQMGAETRELAGRDELVRLAEAFRACPRNLRWAIVTYPSFAIQLSRTVRAVQEARSGRRPADGAAADVRTLAAALARARRAIAADDVPRVAGTIEVRRYDVDPIIAEAAPPTYTFAGDARSAESEHPTAYSLAFFRDVAELAIERVGATWPALGRLIPRFVRILVHLPDGTFRSASAQRYTGVVFLSADDASLLDLEESLVHEYGHQVLYRAMEIDPLVDDDGTAEFTLPWSGSVRDFYGYFHAFYIYALLAEYYSRVRASREPERDRAAERCERIVEGLVRASEDFAANRDRFTRAGVTFSQGLIARVEALADRRHLAVAG